MWILKHGPTIGVRIVSLSVSGDPVTPLAGNVVDEAVSELVEAGISVVAATGNDGQRSLLPPATAPLTITVGGIDDKNSFTDEEIALWQTTSGGRKKPRRLATRKTSKVRSYVGHGVPNHPTG